MEMTTILIREEDSFRRAALLRLFITGTRLLSIDELWTASLGSEQPISTEDAATLGLIGAEMTSLLTEFEISCRSSRSTSSRMPTSSIRSSSAQCRAPQDLRTILRVCGAS